MQPFHLAIVQMDPKIEDLDRNRRSILEGIERAADAGARLVVFPECALSGYVFDSAAAAAPSAETVPGPTSEAVAEACRKHDIHAIVGLLERDGDTIYNSAFIAGPQGLIA